MIDDIQLFLAIAKSLNLTAVANQYNLSKSQVSRRLSHIEDRFHCKLINRTTRHLSLTDAGKELSLAFEQMDSIYRETVENIQNITSSIQGEIKLTAPSTWGSEIITPVLAKFQNKYPDINFKIDLSPAIRDLNIEGYDIAIRAAQQLHDADLKSRKLGRYRFVLCASPSYLKYAGTPQNASDLKNHRCINDITYNFADKKYAWALKKGNQQHHIVTHSTFEVSNYQAQIQLALEGSGIIKIPFPFVKKQLDENNLKMVLEHYQLPEIYLWALYPPNKFLPKRVRLLIDFMATQL